jgi:hypothetical protein
MGLSIEVGYLAEALAEGDPEWIEGFEATLAAVNRVLAAERLPRHVEPRTAPTLASRCSITGFPYSTLHYLRRAYAHRVGDPAWTATAVPDGVDPADDPEVEAQTEQFDSHLLCHSDAEGWYLPIDFPQVVFASEDDDIPGGMLGSTQRLRAELAVVAPALGIALRLDGELADDEAARLDDAVGDQHPLWREFLAWLALWEAARLSLASGCAIVFC